MTPTEAKVRLQAALASTKPPSTVADENLLEYFGRLREMVMSPTPRSTPTPEQCEVHRRFMQSRIDANGGFLPHDYIADADYFVQLVFAGCVHRGYASKKTGSES